MKILKNHQFVIAKTFLLSGVLCLSVACAGGAGKEEDTEVKNALDLITKAPKIAENMEKGVKEAEKRREERVKKGDTLAMNYKDLQKYLPKSPKGFEPDGGPKGESVNMQGLSFSSAIQEYKKGDNNPYNLNKIKG